MHSIRKNNVYILVPSDSVPAGHRCIGSRWVYKEKVDLSYKARVVVQGWGQVPSVDSGSTRAPVCKIQRTCMVLAVAAEYDSEHGCWQLDYNILIRLLNAELNEEVYVKMAPEYKEFDANGTSMVMRPRKSLYGLRQSPDCWWGTVDTHLVEIGFKSLTLYPCVYIYKESGDVYILALYVNDVLLPGKVSKVLERAKHKLMGRFSMTDMGDVSLVLGIEVVRDRNSKTVIISQKRHTTSLVERYEM
ncbi:unnamed protein product, partial [Sphacelaria rigidula]